MLACIHCAAHAIGASPASKTLCTPKAANGPVVLAEVVAELEADALIVTEAVVLPLAGLDAVTLRLGVAVAVCVPAGTCRRTQITFHECCKHRL